MAPRHGAATARTRSACTAVELVRITVASRFGSDTDRFNGLHKALPDQAIMTIIKNDPSTYRLRTKLAAARTSARETEPVLSRAEVEAALREADPHGYVQWPQPAEKHVSRA